MSADHKRAWEVREESKKLQYRARVEKAKKHENEDSEPLMIRGGVDVPAVEREGDIGDIMDTLVAAAEVEEAHLVEAPPPVAEPLLPSPASTSTLTEEPSEANMVEVPTPVAEPIEAHAVEATSLVASVEKVVDEPSFLGNMINNLNVDVDINEIDDILLEELGFGDDRVVTRSFGYHPNDRGGDVVMAQSNNDVVGDGVVGIAGNQSSGDGSDDFN